MSLDELSIDPEADAFLSRELVEAARWDIDAFVTAVMRDEKTGMPLTQAPTHIAWHALAEAHDRLLVWSHAEAGKAVPLTMPIPTPSGWRTMGDLRVGDTVFDRRGDACAVTAATQPQYFRRVYSVRFDDGSSVLADADHRWLARRDIDCVRPPPSAAFSGDGPDCACGCGLRTAWNKGLRRYNTFIHNHHVRNLVPGGWRVVTTAQMLEEGLKRPIGGGYARHRWRIPLTEAVKYPPQNLPVHPYVLGAWLGDGDTKGPTLTFAATDRHVYDRCIALEGGDCPPKFRNGVGRGNIGGFSSKKRNHDKGRLSLRLVQLGVKGNKHIPDAYLTSSVEQRRELLAGLLDTDGSAALGGDVEFCSCLPALAKGTLELIRSLGFKAACHESDAVLNGRVVGRRFRINFKPNVPVFSMPRKLARQQLGERFGRAGYRFVTAIEEVASVPVKCISVDSSDSSYLMGRDYTVTHNTVNLAVARTLFLLGLDPTLRIAIVSNTAAQAEKVIKVIKQYIESSAELHAVFPELRPTANQWTSRAITVRRTTNAKDPSIQTLGVHGNILGSRVDYLIIDDLLDPENTKTAKGREDCFTWVQAALLSRLDARARVLVVGTAFHPEDALHRLARLPGWKAVRYPVLDERGLPRWPERWSLERIAQTRDTLGPLEFARQHLCVARDDSEARFKKEWIDGCLARGAGKTLCYGMDKLPPGFKTYTGVDLAVQQKDASDYSVLFTIAVHPLGDREVLNIERGKWSGAEIVSRIIDTHRRYMSICIVENNACFPPTAPVLTDRGYVPISQVKRGDVVLTHLGRWRRVRGVTSRPYQGPLHLVSPSGGVSVRCTPNHAFWVRESGRVKGSRAAKDVGKHRPIGEPGWASACTLKAGINGEAFYSAMPLARWAPVLPLVEVEKHGRQQCVAVDEELAFVIGLYLAEGGGGGLSQAQFAFSAKESYLADLVERVIGRLFGCTTKRRREGNALRVVINSIKAKRFFDLGKADTKAMQWEWMGWPLPLRLAIVRGWLVGDGCVRTNNKFTRWPVSTLSGYSISRNLILQVRHTLVDAGLRPALKRNPPKASELNGRLILGQESFEVTLNADDTSALLSQATLREEALRWGVPIPRGMRESNSHSVLEEGTLWSKLKRVEPEEKAYDGLVYNLIVEEDESYVVDDVAVHNSQDFIIQFARGQFAVPIRPFTTGRNKAHPEFGVESIAAEMAGKKWIIPSHNGQPAHPELQNWIQEMLFYQPSAHTGDALMASWFAREGYRLASNRVETGNISTLAR